MENTRTASSARNQLQPPPTPAPAVDCHAHVFTRSLPLVEARRYTPAREASVDDYLRMLAENRVTHGVLVQPSFLGTDNSFLLEALRQQPERLRGVVVLPPETPPQQLHELDRQGVRGVRLNLVGCPIPPLHESLWQRHLFEIAALDWHVEVHARCSNLPEILDPLLAAGVRIVVDHFGRLEEEGVRAAGFRHLLSVASTGRVWVKLSAPYRLPGGEAQAREALGLLRQAFGLDRLLWGSDWPHTEFEEVASPAAAREQCDCWFPDTAEREIVLVRTPARLFGFSDLLASQTPTGAYVVSGRG